jgi:glyoxylate reductase
MAPASASPRGPGATGRPKALAGFALGPRLVGQLGECDLTVIPGGWSDKAFANALRTTEGVLVNSHVPIDAAAIGSAPHLRVISTMSVGTDHIDLAAARAQQIAVTITPVLSDAVADVTIALITMLARRLPESMRAVTDGHWGEVPLGSDLAAKQLFIIGFGRIGRAVATRALAAKMRVSAFDTQKGSFGIDGVERVRDLRGGLRAADFVSLHVDLNKTTQHLIGRDQIDEMKSTAFLINTSRGAVVDQQALLSALADGKIAGAGLDVLEEEPPRADEPLLAVPNVIIVPHIGSATVETRASMAQCAVDNLLAGLRGDTLDYNVAGA